MTGANPRSTTRTITVSAQNEAPRPQAALRAERWHLTENRV